MPDLFEQIVQNLLLRGVEDRTLEYKGPMAWQGDRPKKLNIIKDIVCMANSRGGHILIGVEETDSAYLAVGCTEPQQASFDQTHLASLAREYFSPAPVFTVRKETVDGLRFVLIETSEFDDTPVLCTRNSDPILRRGALYVRTDDPVCEEIRSSDQLRALIDKAVTKRGDALLRQIADLMSSMGIMIEGRGSRDDQYDPAMAEAAEFLAESGPGEPYWQVTLRPTGEQVSVMRAGLLEALRASKADMRGWDFPHIDERVINSFENGVESAFSWQWYTEAFRAFRNGAFAWRGRTTEEFTPEGNVDIVSVIFTMTEFLAFAADYADHAYGQQGLVLSVEAIGISGHRLWMRPGHQLYKTHEATADRFAATRDMSYPELRASHAEVARQLTEEFFELFNWYDSSAAIAQWQRRLVERDL